MGTAVADGCSLCLLPLVECKGGARSITESLTLRGRSSGFPASPGRISATQFGAGLQSAAHVLSCFGGRRHFRCDSLDEGASILITVLVISLRLSEYARG
ncbi:hypothetical protein FKM82_025391 [Ascaphus truei]